MTMFGHSNGISPLNLPDRSASPLSTQSPTVIVGMAPVSPRGMQQSMIFANVAMAPDPRHEDLNHVALGIWIGSHYVLKSAQPLLARGITRVMNAAIEFITEEPEAINWDDLQRNGIEVYNTMWDDTLAFPIFPSPGMELALKKIDENVRAGQSVLVNCAQGKSRSCSLVIAYLMARQGMSYDEALETCKRARPQVQPNANFERQLRQLEASLRSAMPKSPTTPVSAPALKRARSHSSSPSLAPQSHGQSFQALKLPHSTQTEPQDELTTHAPLHSAHAPKIVPKLSLPKAATHHQQKPKISPRPILVPQEAPVTVTLMKTFPASVYVSSPSPSRSPSPSLVQELITYPDTAVSSAPAPTPSAASGALIIVVPSAVGATVPASPLQQAQWQQQWQVGATEQWQAGGTMQRQTAVSSNDFGTMFTNSNPQYLSGNIIQLNGFASPTNRASQSQSPGLERAYTAPMNSYNSLNSGATVVRLPNGMLSTNGADLTSMGSFNGMQSFNSFSGGMVQPSTPQRQQTPSFQFQMASSPTSPYGEFSFSQMASAGGTMTRASRQNGSMSPLTVNLNSGQLAQLANGGGTMVRAASGMTMTSPNYAVANGSNQMMGYSTGGKAYSPVPMSRASPAYQRMSMPGGAYNGAYNRQQRLVR